ncbi:MAG TPA: FkbM family methyltransferase [Pyrinomonadaceae bacterium]|nr:FkbM family methyltransferase [Pyrinomonadaceae bacterium]
MIAVNEQDEFIELVDNNPLFISSVKVRGIPIRYYTLNKRLQDISRKMEILEPDLLDWIDHIEPDAVLYDIGASNGPFTMYAALKDLQLVAFEPEAQNYAILEMNHYLNRSLIKHSVISLNMALSNATGLGKMFCRNYIAGTHVKILDQPFRRLERDTFDPAHVQFVIKETLDAVIEKFSLPAPKYIKIDVDGVELELLQGATQTLQSEGLKEIFIEIAHPETDGKEIKEIIEQSGFREQSRRQVEHYEHLYNLVYTRKQD